jgi:hypothetical protein
MLTCAFGVDWKKHYPKMRCPACRAESERLDREFWLAFDAYKFDIAGYTPAERREKEKQRGRRDHQADTTEGR